MTKQDPAMVEITKMNSAATVVRAYANSESSRASVAMLDALIESYKLDLMDVTPEKLVCLQSCIRQSVAIRDVLADASADIPKIL